MFEFPNKIIEMIILSVGITLNMVHEKHFKSVSRQKELKESGALCATKCSLGQWPVVFRVLCC